MTHEHDRAKSLLEVADHVEKFANGGRVGVLILPRLGWLLVGADYAVAAKRNSALWRELAAVPADAWTPARAMPGAQVAVIDYAPARWPPDAYTVVRRVRVDAADISTDPRSRRRRTIAKDQLALCLGGELDHAWAVSFIVTNLPTSTPADVVALECWFRGRTDI